MTVLGNRNIHISLALFFIVISFLAFNANAESLSSANYRIDVDVMDTGGDSSFSLNYDLSDSIGQSSIIGLSSSTAYHIYGGFWDTLSGIGVNYSISGSGYNYPEPGYRASLSLNILESSLGTGWLKYYYNRLRIVLISTLMTSMVVVGNACLICNGLLEF